MLHDAFTLTMLLILFTLLFSLHLVSAQGTCQQINSCSCSYGNDQVVDLSPLNGDPPPKWSDQYDTQFLNKYSYNPCDPFSEGKCANVAVCQNTGISYFECGTQDTAVFLIDPVSGALSVQYTSTDAKGFIRKSVVTLTCQKGAADALTVQGESAATPGLYTFELVSDHCCPKSGPPPSGGGSDDSSLSVGSILVIAFFAIVVVYFVGGILLMKFGKKQSGRDVIPNAGFWTSLPSYVKDGVMFVVKRGKSSPQYDKI